MSDKEEPLQFRTPAYEAYKEPPEGWFSFGTHVGNRPESPRENIRRLEFSEEVGEDGFPLWERPSSEAEAPPLYELGPDGGCPTDGCRGDVRYAAPGRGHIDSCIYPRGAGHVQLARSDLDPTLSFQAGDVVEKIQGYEFDSTVVSVFRKLDGEVRLVCESHVIPGMLHIFSPKQMRLKDLT